MQFNQFSYIEKIIQAGSISEAAKHLYITQSALSQRVLALEKSIGHPIFNRNTSPISLTYEGTLFYNMVQAMEESENDFWKAISDIDQEKGGQLKIAMTTFRIQQVLHLLLPKFKNRYPNVEFILLNEFVEDIEDLVLSGKADLAFISRRTSNPELEYQQIASGEFIASVPPAHPIARSAEDPFDWRKRAPLDLSLLKNESFIQVTGYPHFEDQISQIFEAYGFTPNIYLSTTDFSTAHRLSINGAGISIIHDIAAIQSYPYGAYFRLDRGPAQYSLRLCYKKGRYVSEIMRSFIQMSVETYSELFAMPLGS